MVYVGVASVAALASAYSIADLVAWPGDNVGSMLAMTAPGTAGDPALVAVTTSPEAVRDPSPCWRNWPYIETGCDAAGSRTASVPAAPPGRLGSTGAPVHQDIKGVVTTSSVAASLVGEQATDGSGRRFGAPAGGGNIAGPVVADGTSAQGPAFVATAPAEAAPAPSPAVAAMAAPPAVPSKLSDRDLTFAHGYAQRLAALGRTVKNSPAPPRASKPHVVRKAAHAKPHKGRATVQVYQLPDGRKVVVHRQYGRRYEAAQVAPTGGPRGFRSAENGAQRSGGLFGERRGWFW